MRGESRMHGSEGGPMEMGRADRHLASGLPYYAVDTSLMRSGRSPVAQTSSISCIDTSDGRISVLISTNCVTRSDWQIIN